jgi:ZIP family zinc transporter
VSHDLWLPLAVCAFAGLSTGIGGALAVVLRSTHTGILGAGLGMSGGAMVYVSFVELVPTAATALGEPGVGAWTIGAFFAGIAAIALIDWFVPGEDNPHEAVLVGDVDPERKKLGRIGLLSALAIAIHNFPEGIASFYATVHDPAIGVSVGVAIGLHNLPEGLAVALPIYYATGKRGKAFAYALLSGLAEPVGALVAYFAVGQHLDGRGMGILIAAVAGVMVFLALDQLIPNAKRYGSGHESVYGLVVGMLLMAITVALT